MGFHILDFNYKTDERIIERLFKPIRTRNTILFLGAGASVTDENKFLSQDIIDLYEAAKSISLKTKDIIEFVDILSSNTNFNRDEFDNFVDNALRRLRPNKGHKLIAKLNWKTIITTNYDLLVERSFQEIEGTSDENLRLKYVKKIDEYYYMPSDDELMYIKLNGCIYDKKEFPLVFSTEDFKKAEKFYKIVLKPLQSVSDKVNFLSIGYSYSDLFAKKLLQIIDNYNFRQKRILYNVDPYISNDSLSWFEQKCICIVKCTMDQFFSQYEEWENESGKLIKVASKNYYTNVTNAPVYIINKKLLQRVDNNLVQFNEHFKSKFISQTNFLQGEEPNYNVILKNYDVAKTQILNNTKLRVLDILESNNSRIVPLIFLTGTFGTGKSTFAYRLIKNIIDSDIEKSLAFEIIDPGDLKSVDLKELFSKTGASIIILYINSIEVNTVFKSLLELRSGLGVDFSPEYKIILLSTIRENMLEKLRLDKELKNSHVIKVDCSLTRVETSELVEKLKESGLVNYRDATSKEVIVKKIIHDYQGDSFISLLELISGSKLINDLTEAYEQLNEVAQEAFLYTSMLYQFKILMPSALLKDLVNKEWDDFRKEVIEIDGKGILIQDDTSNVKHADPDLFFRTKHPLISEKLINNILRDEERKYTYAKKIITVISLGSKNSRLVINFLKSLDQNLYFSRQKINSLFDLAENTLNEDPYFLLHFAINLQKRKTKEDINYAIEKIIYAESFFRYRNHYLIHRRGVLNFALAKLYFEENQRTENFKVLNLLNESRDLLDIKQRLDPSSSFSYYDIINLEIWILENLNLEEVEELKIRIKIEELFDLSSKVVFDNVNKILELQNKYIANYKFNENPQEYLEFIDNKYNKAESRPYGLILKYNFFHARHNKFQEIKLIDELEDYSDNNYVLKTLFIFYGRNLHKIDYRIKFFKLVAQYPEIETIETLRYNYFNFIAECYNMNFSYAYGYLTGINKKFNSLNPDFNREWLDSTTDSAQIFEGFLKLNKKGKKVILIPYLSNYFFLYNSNSKLEINKKVEVILRFFLFGIRAEIINSLEEFSLDKHTIEQENEFEV